MSWDLRKASYNSFIQKEMYTSALSDEKFIVCFIIIIN